MRILLAFTLTLLVLSINAQDTIYFNKSGKKITNPDRAHTFEVRIANPDNPDQVSVEILLVR